MRHRSSSSAATRRIRRSRRPSRPSTATARRPRCRSPLPPTHLSAPVWFRSRRRAAFRQSSAWARTCSPSSDRVRRRSKEMRHRIATLLGVGIVLSTLGRAEVEAQTFNSGSTGADGAFSPTVNTTVTLPASGVLNYTTINIPVGVTVKFTKNAANTPVTILATGNVTIAGTIDIRGNAGAPPANGTAVGTTGGAGGPGGFDGGNGATGTVSTTGGSGRGPGGGTGSTGAAGAGGGGFGAAGGNGTAPSGATAGIGGSVYA